MTNTVMPNCPFCLDNHLLKGDIIAETDGGFLIEAYPQKDHFLLIPKRHTEKLTDLADDWWVHVKQLFPKVPLTSDSYNISLNYGAPAGQTLAHLHFWVIPRHADLPASGKGLASLVSDANGTNPVEE